MTKNLPRADIFNKIVDIEEKNRILSEVISTRGEIIAKLSDSESEVLILNGTQLKAEELTCKIIGIVTSLGNQKGELILTYHLSGEKYFQICPFSQLNTEIKIQTKNALFHLQRREDYRLKLAPESKVLLETIKLNGKQFKKSFQILDLSGGGCKIKIPKIDVKLETGNELEGHIFTLDREPIEIVGIVRHSKPEQDNSLIVGVQFLGSTKHTKSKGRIIALVLDLYREMFSGR